MTTTVPTSEPASVPAATMTRRSWYLGADIAALLDQVVQDEWLERRAEVPKHQILDALLLLAVEHREQLPQYLTRLAERRATGEKG